MDIIDLFFIVLTGIIAYRLYTALGQRDEGQEPPRPSKNFSEEWGKRSAPSTQEEKKELDKIFYGDNNYDICVCINIISAVFTKEYKNQYRSYSFYNM